LASSWGTASPRWRARYRCAAAAFGSVSVVPVHLPAGPPAVPSSTTSQFAPGSAPARSPSSGAVSAVGCLGRRTAASRRFVPGVDSVLVLITHRHTAVTSRHISALPNCPLWDQARRLQRRGRGRLGTPCLRAHVGRSRSLRAACRPCSRGPAHAVTIYPHRTADTDLDRVVSIRDRREGGGLVGCPAAENA
jgi:hypothetical protein